MSDVAIVARWRAKMAVRKGLLAYARRQAAYWRAKKSRAKKGTTAYSHAGAMLAARERKVSHRRDQVDYAARVIARHAASAKPSEPQHATRKSPNQSSRGGAKIRVIVLHATEGAYAGAVDWLCNPGAQASAHVVVSRTGKSTRLVDDDAKAWHVAADNPFTLGIEQEGYSARDDWPDAELHATARWVAYWSVKHDIPCSHSTSHGVCRHSDLGAQGGGHHDPGAHYDLAHVLSLARGYGGKS